MSEIRALWDEHAVQRFPRGLGGEEVNGIDLVMLDADTAGCITTFLANGGNLDTQRRNILQQCHTELQTVIQQLAGEPAAYFTSLERIALLVLKEVPVT